MVSGVNCELLEVVLYYFILHVGQFSSSIIGSDEQGDDLDPFLICFDSRRLNTSQLEGLL